MGLSFAERRLEDPGGQGVSQVVFFSFSLSLSFCVVCVCVWV